MREIKFRIWNKRDEEMLFSEYVGYRGEYNCIEWGLNDYPGTTGPWAPEIEDLELMQYTGLKDKNGKEVYEGDIVVGDFGVRRLGVVEYFTNGWKEFRCVGCFVVRHHILDGHAESDMVDMSNLESPKYNGQDIALCEVLGNIYENPELLKENK